jgi:hypothetical protein
MRALSAARRLGPCGVAWAPMTGPHRVAVAMQALTSASSWVWFQPLMKSTCSVSTDPCMVGDMETVMLAAVDVGYTRWNTIWGMTTGCEVGHPDAVGLSFPRMGGHLV